MYSMTGFSQKLVKHEWGAVSLELRTVNHRFSEVSLRLPEVARYLEPKVRQLAKASLHRGKVDLSMRLQLTQEAGYDVLINEPLLAQLSVALNQVQQQFPSAQQQAIDLLAWPGVVIKQEHGIAHLETDILAAFEQVLADCVSTRAVEGSALQAAIQLRLDAMQVMVTELLGALPELQEQVRQQLQAKCDQWQVSVDPQRFEQEVVFYLQKIDVAEELDRLSAHLLEMDRVMRRAEPIGRRLDFLVQEMNREVNTLGSKSVDLRFTKASVELKVCIEQIREQVQNIE